MMIHSDWHIHSEASYDASLTLNEIHRATAELNFRNFGVTDHVNYNDDKFVADLKKSAAAVKEFKKDHPHVRAGTELTPINKAQFEYIQKTGTRDGYDPAKTTKAAGIELARTKEELMALGLQYAIGAAHWRLDCAEPSADLKKCIDEWYRLQMWLANDERVTILGHPWWNSAGLWYTDFSVIPHSMHMELAAALKENHKYVECNAHFFRSDKGTEKFRHQYAEFLRELHEMGIPVTYGSDSHAVYFSEAPSLVEKYLSAAGFKDGDIAEIAEEDFWQ